MMMVIYGLNLHLGHLNEKKKDNVLKLLMHTQSIKDILGNVSSRCVRRLQ